MRLNLFAFLTLSTLALSACSDGAPDTRVGATLEMAQIFAGIENKTSADAAVESFIAFSKRLDALPPTPETEKKDAEFAVGRLFSQIARIKREQYFESDALKNALAENP